MLDHSSRRRGPALRLGLATAIGLLASGAPAAAYSKVSIASFSNAVDIAVAPGFASHLYVVEQAGKVRLMIGATKIATPFLDLSTLVTFSDERGLLSVAFPPDHASTRLFYVLFVNTDGDIEVDEYKRLATTDRRADPASRRRLLVAPHRQAAYHNGGRLQFDAAGLLYISIGDGGATPQFAPDRSKLLGKLLRIDPKPSKTRPYTLPPDNPFVGKAGMRGEIFAYGFRNPWRFSLAGGVLAIGDVGQSTWEEVDFVTLAGAKGHDFGWPHYEGRVVYDGTTPAPSPLRFPAFVYAHVGGRCAIVGGLVVKAPDLPQLAGRYLYGDYCTGEIRSFAPDPAKNTASGDAATGVSAQYLRTFGTDSAGHVLFSDGSTLYRLAP